METRPKYLLRLFSNKLYAEEFISRGRLYMNTLGYFRNLESNFQGDCYEGDLLNGENGVTMKWHTDDNCSTEEIQITSIPIDGFVYCFFAIYEEQLKITGNSLEWFGETCNLLTAVKKYREENGASFIVLLDFDAVYSKIQEALDKEPLNRFPSLIDNVKYCKVPSLERVKALFEMIQETPRAVDTRVENNLRRLAFIKPESYAYQQELRVFIYCTPDKECSHFDLHLGNLGSCLLFYGDFKPVI